MCVVRGGSLSFPSFFPLSPPCFLPFSSGFFFLFAVVRSPVSFPELCQLSPLFPAFQDGAVVHVGPGLELTSSVQHGPNPGILGTGGAVQPRRGGQRAHHVLYQTRSTPTGPERESKQVSRVPRVVR